MDIYILYKFSAGWCSPCKALAKTLNQVLPEFSNITVVNIDIDEETDKATEYKVRSIPTLIMLKDNEEVARIVGNCGADQLKEFLTH